MPWIKTSGTMVVYRGDTDEVELRVEWTGSYNLGQAGGRGGYGEPLEPDDSPEYSVDVLATIVEGAGAGTTINLTPAEFEEAQERLREEVEAAPGQAKLNRHLS